jgi:hypothetical protein
MLAQSESFSTLDCLSVISNQDKKIATTLVLLPPPIQEYQHRLIARTNTATTSEIAEMEMKARARKLGQMSSVWELSQATSQTLSISGDWNPEFDNSLTTGNNQDEDLFLDLPQNGSLRNSSNSGLVLNVNIISIVKSNSSNIKDFRRPSSFGDLMSHGK